MPYISKEKRKDLQVRNPTTPGELNYTISVICHDYVLDHPHGYATMNDVIGVLECAKLELYRQVVSRYEDLKKQQNGAVSELDA